MSTRQIRRFCQVDGEARSLLERAMDRLGLSARAHQRVLRVARTIADLEGVLETGPSHVAEALRYRPAASSGPP